MKVTHQNLSKAPSFTPPENLIYTRLSFGASQAPLCRARMAFRPLPAPFYVVDSS